MALSLVPTHNADALSIDALIVAADGGEAGSVSRLCGRGDIVPYLRWIEDDGERWDVGHAVEHVLGLSREAFLDALITAKSHQGDSMDDDGWLSLMHRDDRGLARKVIGETGGNEQHVVQYRLLDASGHYCWIRDEMRVIHDNEERVLAIVGCWLHLDGKSIDTNRALTAELREVELLADVLCARTRVRLLERDAGDLKQHLHWARQRASRRGDLANVAPGSLQTPAKPRLVGLAKPGPSSVAPDDRANAADAATSWHRPRSAQWPQRRPKPWSQWKWAPEEAPVELVLFGQPAAALDPLGRAPLDVEVLLRAMPSPETIDLPHSVLESARKQGLSASLDQWVLENALSVLVESGSAHKTSIAINISQQSISDPILVDWLQQHIDHYDVAAQCISFEIDERCVAGDIDAAKRLMSRLRDLGCRVTIDDFGIGGLGLYSLRDLPLDSVKLAGVMVEDLSESKINRTFISALAAFASTLGLSTIAKHAQDAATLKLLSELGIQAAQGRFVQVPRPLSELLSM